jgi:serine/threonine protein kinase
LGAGQFGDVWEATDTATGEKVAVKVFYQHTPSGKQYLTWNTADQANREEMKKNIKECELVRNIISQGKSAYPVGASRICECKGEYIKQGMENKDNVMYTVWEMCGKSLTKLRTELGSFSAADRQQAARLMTKQVLEGIYLFSMFSPKLIHHDMKADNAVVLGSLEEGYEVKLIDFGCFVRASPGNKHSQSIGDPDYMPPEHTMYKAFEDPPSSFDSYGVGLLHMELLCPALQTTDWSPAQAMRANPRLMMTGQKVVLSMITIKKAMMKRCPELFSSDVNGGAITDDLDLIEKLTYLTPARRLLPEVALEHNAMQATADTKIKLEFGPGDKVEYYSVSRGGVWIPCQVQSLNTEFGYYNLLEEVPGGLIPLHSLAAPAKVKAQVLPDTLSVDESFQVPLVAMTFNVGDKVEYYQSTNNQWIGCTISKVSQPQDGVGMGTYDLILPDGTPYRTGVLPERVREPPFSPGTRVLVYTDILGIVESYDAATETYRVKHANKAGTTYPSVPREFIVLNA